MSRFPGTSSALPVALWRVQKRKMETQNIKKQTNKQTKTFFIIKAAPQRHWHCASVTMSYKGQTGADPLDDFSLYIGPMGIFLDWTDSLWALSLCGCWGICLCCHHRSQQPSLQLCCHIFTPTDAETHDQVGWNKQSICGLVYAGWVASVRGTATAVKLQPWTHNRTQSRQVYRWVQPGRENLILVLELILKTQELLVLISDQSDHPEWIWGLPVC